MSDAQKLSESEELQQQSLVDTMPTPVTAVDPLGVERIVVVDPNPGSYTAPPVEPDEHEVYRLKELQKKIDKRHSERNKELGAQVDPKTVKAAQKAESVGTAKAGS